MVIKLFSTQLKQMGMEFKLLIKTKILKNNDLSCFQTFRCCFYHSNKMQTIVGILAG